ncbi:MAG: hypothetical protein FWC56_00975 [Phycisphaerae bacterium]|nr:hypothetical protein [Phycisphaerae bacterium]
MAKQNVGFAERHLEKIVVGVAGAVLVGAVFLYVIRDPYSMQVGNDSLSPSAFYKQMGTKAGEVLSQIKGARAPEPSEWKPPVLLATNKGELLPVVTGPLNPPVPKLETNIQVGDKLDLVAILPPGKPVLTVGRGAGTLPEPTHKAFDSNQKESKANANSNPGEKGTANELHWVAAFATVPRLDQQKVFMEAKYPVASQQMMVVKVDAQRQRLLPDGQWQEPAEEVTPFNTDVYVPPVIQINRDNDESVVPMAELESVQKMGQELRQLQAQSTVLRPDFQGRLETNFRHEWKVPDELPGHVKFDWAEEYKIAVSEKSAASPEASTSAGPARRLTPAKALEEIDTISNQGITAENAKDYIAAKDFFDQALDKVKQAETLAGISPKDKDDLNSKKTNLQQRLDKLKPRLEEVRKSQAAAREASLGPDIDVCWVTDPTAEPGQVYRYRIRLEVLNSQAGILNKLKNPQDAEKVVLTGAWSDWSGPVSLPAAQHLLFTGLDSATGGAKVELYQWAASGWKNSRYTLALGQLASWIADLQEYDYDAVILALEPDRPYEERSIDPKRKTIRYSQSRPTAAVVYVNAAGEIEEHLQQQDAGLRRQLNEENSKLPQKDSTARPSPGPNVRPTGNPPHPPGGGPGRPPAGSPSRPPGGQPPRPR